MIPSTSNPPLSTAEGGENTRNSAVKEYVVKSALKSIYNGDIVSAEHNRTNINSKTPKGINTRVCHWVGIGWR